MVKHDSTPLHALASKWNRPQSSGYLGPTESMNRAHIVVAQTALLPTRIPSRIKYHIFELIHNAVPTRVRERWRGHSLQCPICAGHDESISHLHIHCPASRLAITYILNHHPDKHRLMILRTATNHDYDFTSTTCSPHDRRVLAISLAVWRTSATMSTYPTTTVS